MVNELYIIVDPLLMIPRVQSSALLYDLFQMNKNGREVKVPYFLGSVLLCHNIFIIIRVNVLL